MGFGDPYHKHPLSLLYPTSTSNCFHCELPITDYACYGCRDCDYYIHKSCHNLPIKLRHPIHDQHSLTLYQPPPNSSCSDSQNLLCNECQNPCLDRFAYHCTTCQFYFHLKCLFTLNHDKHHHPLIFGEISSVGCKICGFDIYGFAFGCNSCNFDIHPQCSLIPLEVKRHHVHQLTLRHNFPEECDQVYCDLCEDRDGEMDRELSYYYCKDCDYIAHVPCCITQPGEDVLLCERFTHEHPLSHKQTEALLSCTQCSYVVSNDTSEYPSLIKHPRHPNHTLFADWEGDIISLNCTECDFSMDALEFFSFTHPLWRYKLSFDCKNNLFRCDACGQLGKGSRVGYGEGEFDLHLECFGLPGKLEHESHPNHPLYLRWLYNSTDRDCSVCTKEMDPQLWFYFCQECDYAAHIDCVGHDLLPTPQSSIKNQPDLCAFIETDKSLFKYQIADMRPPADQYPSYSLSPPTLEPPSDIDDDDDDDDEDEDEGNNDLGIETVGYELACPKCSSVIPTQAAYSTIKGWKSGFLKNSIATANDESPLQSEPLSLLDEQIIDKLYCFICNMLIFPPTYSCASCQIYFHKSCAELPRKILYDDTTYALMAPPFPEGLSDCSHCKYTISSWAYLSSKGRIIFDVQCAAGAPLANLTYHDDMLPSKRALYETTCEACDNDPEIGTIVLACDDCNFYLHPECGLLPPVIKHRIHWHQLEIATNLATLYDEYICDACEKDLNPNLWAYRCVDECGIRATSHVSCVITSKKKCHFSYDRECENMTEEQKQEFRRKARERGIKL